PNDRRASSSTSSTRTRSRSPRWSSSPCSPCAERSRSCSCVDGSVHERKRAAELVVGGAVVALHHELLDVVLHLRELPLRRRGRFLGEEAQTFLFGGDEPAIDRGLADQIAR